MSEQPQGIDRREALRRIGGTALAAAAAVGAGFALHDPRSGTEYFRDQAAAAVVTLPLYGVEVPAGNAPMAIAHGTDSGDMVRRAIGAMGGIEAYIKPGDVVVLKPNVAFDRGPALGATTSPEVVAAVGKLCLEAGAKVVRVIDNPINQSEGCFYKSGVGPAAQAAGLEVVLPTPDKFEELAVGRFREASGHLSGLPGEALDRWPFFYAPFKDATKVIGIAPCKDHNLCGASLSMKNFYGLLGGRRNQFHQHIHSIISDFPLMIQPTLVVLDATRILMRHGPTGGSLADIKPGNTIAVATDMVALDSFGYTLFERRESPPAYLAKAEQRGLGSTDWQSLAREV